MRIRQEIQEELLRDYSSDTLHRIFLEVLLDIRHQLGYLVMAKPPLKDDEETLSETV